MLTCPMCKKKLRGLEPSCYSCKADVSLLVNYVANLAEGLARAERATKAGELDKAVWAYLEVLEVDPDNAIARRQVGSVATAVRQFDETAPGRRWLTKLHKKYRWKRWLQNAEESGSLAALMTGFLWVGVVLVALIIGYVMGTQTPRPPGSGDTPPASGTTDPKKTSSSTEGQPGKGDGTTPKTDNQAPKTLPTTENKAPASPPSSPKPTAPPTTVPKQSSPAPPSSAKPPSSGKVEKP